MGFGKLRVLNDSVIQPGRGFPEHGHADFEIVTVQLQGQLSHTDSLGTRTIQAHDVQLITAGTGVSHSDLNTGAEEARQLQIWVEPRRRGLPPASALRTFRPDQQPGRWLVVVAPAVTAEAPEALLMQQDAWFSLGHFPAGQPVPYVLHGAVPGVYLFVLEGRVEINGLVLERRDAVAISFAEAFVLLPLTTCELLAIEVPLR